MGARWKANFYEFTVTAVTEPYLFQQELTEHSPPQLGTF